MKRIIYGIICIAMLSGCSVYRNYRRPQDLPTEDLYRDVQEASADTASLGNLSWQEVFRDTLLQHLINYGLENNTDIQVALLRVDQAKAQLKAAKLAFLPSLAFSPQGALNSIDGGKAAKTYELPIEASWEIDLFGKLRNAKKGAQAGLLGQEAYRRAVQSALIAGIANSYYTLLMLDEQIAISASTLDLWKEQVRTMESKLKVGEETENAVTSARAGFYELEVTYNDLLRQMRETENALCTLLGMTSRPIERGVLGEQTLPENLNAGIPLRLLSRRPDVIQAEMALANAYYTTNQARAAFYPALTLSGSVGWTNSLGQVITNPGGWIASALASLAQPLFNRGKLASNLRVSKDEEQIALLDYKQALLDAGQEVNDALYAAEAARRNLNSHRKQCDELERTVQTSEALYRTGNTTYLELLTARQSLLNARMNVVADTFTRLQAVISLYNALGGGAE
ncbi:efflux transporter outer membrane subunit [Bacteroides sp. AN502(2024)]|uniref:efflux transporter outer membrane subunit n=1 Tax=Bacteroides sp. AN502(2024) TaxID=3160599 RepID=UPI0035188A34